MLWFGSFMNRPLTPPQGFFSHLVSFGSMAFEDRNDIIETDSDVLLLPQTHDITHGQCSRPPPFLTLDSE